MTGAPLPDRASAPLVLVVDDVPDNLTMLHDALDEAGYTVLMALDGKSALQRAAHSLPDATAAWAVARRWRSCWSSSSTISLPSSPTRTW